MPDHVPYNSKEKEAFAPGALNSHKTWHTYYSYFHYWTPEAAWFCVCCSENMLGKKDNLCGLLVYEVGCCSELLPPPHGPTRQVFSINLRVFSKEKTWPLLYSTCFRTNWHNRILAHNTLLFHSSLPTYVIINSIIIANDMENAPNITGKLWIPSFLSHSLVAVACTSCTT